MSSSSSLILPIRNFCKRELLADPGSWFSARPPEASEHEERNAVSTSTPIVSAGAPIAEHADLRRLSWLFLVLGLVSMLIGILAIGAPLVATTKSVIVVLLIIAGLTEAIQAVIMRNLRGFAIHLLAAALYLMVGFFVIEDPDRA